MRALADSLVSAVESGNVTAAVGIVEALRALLASLDAQAAPSMRFG